MIKLSKSRGGCLLGYMLALVCDNIIQTSVGVRHIESLWQLPGSYVHTQTVENYIVTNS